MSYGRIKKSAGETPGAGLSGKIIMAAVLA